MQIYRFYVPFVFACFFLTNCVTKVNPATSDTESTMSSTDSISKVILETFALTHSERMDFDSSSLIFYCSRSYDTSSLIEIKKQKDLIKGAYYEILPEYHRFRTDYADSNFKLMFFEGYSFIIDSASWKVVSDQARIVLQNKEDQSKNLKYTDGGTYALYYNGASVHGNSNNEAPFEKFDSLLRTQFLDKFKQLRKPIMHKGK